MTKIPVTSFGSLTINRLTLTVLLITLLGFSSALSQHAYGQDSGGNPPAFSGVVVRGKDYASSKPSDFRETVLLCFTLVSVSSLSVQPYILQPGYLQGDPKAPCSTIDEKHPLVDGQKLVIAIAARQDMWGKKIELINVNLTTQQATPLNPAPVRGVVTPRGLSVKTGILYVPWPSRLAGDTVAEVTIKMLYLPPGSGAKETVISLLDMSYPQVHSLSHYNVATGVVGSTVENPSFFRVQTSAASGTPGSPGFTPAQFKTIKNGGDPEVAPVLMFTIYVPPFDAERAWRAKDLIPQPSFGFSLSSPSTDFFFGASSEIRRNIQFVAGLHVGKVTTLVQPAFDDPTSSTAPQTQQSFAKGAFFGLTFNIDFIKGLFGK